MSSEERELRAQKNRDAVKKCMQGKDRINVILPKGTNERIHALGFSGNSFAKGLILRELEYLEGLKNQ